ncbi:MAG TPA: tetratricopeptide repeat protein [Candidatus Binataceae bacterium]|nr:tetratricopeptide repeat protein [Candidatus Binataceae bacterium]
MACAVAVVLAAVMLAGCLGDQIKANQTLLEQQQVQLDQLKQQVVSLQTQRATDSSTYPAAGACDEAVMREAARKGGERFAAGDFAHALPYYQDAVTSCPKNSSAQLNLARTFEANGDRPEALVHYRLAAEATGSDADSTAVRQAREALGRLQPSASHGP